MPPAALVDLLVILAAGLVAALVCRRLGISTIVGYLVIGALLGEGALGWVRGEQHEIGSLAEAGVFLLLFSIGLEFSLEELVRLGRHLLIGGSAQMLLVGVPVGIGLRWAGVGVEATLVLSAAVAFSSTVIVFNTLSDVGQFASQHGKRAIGVLLFQDLALVPMLLFVPMLAEGEAPPAGDLVRLAAFSVLFVVGVFLLRAGLRNWVIPWLAGFRSPDLVILLTLVTLGGITMGANLMGLTPAVGAFAAGLAFGGNRWSGQIDALILPFRETCAAIFFVSLGLLLDLGSIDQSPMSLLMLVAVVVAVKLVAASLALRLSGLSWRSSWAMGLGLAHIGEFALILAKFGRESEVISESDYQRLVSVALGTLLLTPLMLRLGLRWVDNSSELEDVSRGKRSDIPVESSVVIGVGPIGRQTASYLETQGIDVTLVDRSPINLHSFAQMGFHTVAGDATEEKVLREAHLSHASLVVVCVPEDLVGLEIVERIRELTATARVIVRCRYQANVPRFLEAKASHVISEEHQAYEELVGHLASWLPERPDAES
jgi:CPA2 family monovalent cation:H+ antiporter-2